VLLSSKFQRAVDRAKRKAGIYTAEEDIAQWRRTSEPCGEGLDHVEVRYLPANLHNRPERIVPALRTLLDEIDPERQRTVLFGYADCGTGGSLDRFLDELESEFATAGGAISRIPGHHCYEFFAGSALFHSLHDEEPGTLYLTDFLAKHFDALVWQGLGLHEHPSLRDMYFGNYTRVVLLSQTDDPAVLAAGEHAAEQLGLAFEHVHVARHQFASAVQVGVRGRH
jgi:hypothetical protein